MFFQIFLCDYISKKIFIPRLFTQKSLSLSLLNVFYIVLWWMFDDPLD